MNLNKAENYSMAYGFKRKEDQYFPHMVFVEITNVCNLRCIHCPYSFISKQTFYRPRHMDLGIYKKIVNEVAQFKGIIFRLVCDGEPMMHPNFIELLSYARQKGIRPLCFNTNGTLLDHAVTVEVLKNEVDVIEISLDAITESTYRKIRQGGNYQEVIENVNRLVRLRNQLQLKTKIMVSIIDQPQAHHEIQEFRRYWEARVDRVIIRAFTSIGGLINQGRIKEEGETGRWPCPLPWTRVFVSVDGLIKFCVEDWLDKTVVDNLRETTIQTAWQSEKYRQLRSEHLAKKFESIPYCRDCLDWPARKWDYDYFSALEKILSP